MVTLLDSSPSICLPKATALRQETRAVCENQLLSSRRFAKHFMHCCTQNSDRRIRTPADERNGWREIASSTEGAVFGGQMPGGPGGSPFMA